MARSRSRFPGVSALFVATLLLVFLPTLGCQPASQEAAALTVGNMALDLEDHLDAATIVGKLQRG